MVLVIPTRSVRDCASIAAPPAPTAIFEPPPSVGAGPTCAIPSEGPLPPLPLMPAPPLPGWPPAPPAPAAAAWPSSQKLPTGEPFAPSAPPAPAAEPPPAPPFVASKNASLNWGCQTYVTPSRATCCQMPALPPSPPGPATCQGAPSHVFVPPADGASGQYSPRTRRQATSSHAWALEKSSPSAVAEVVRA